MKKKNNIGLALSGGGYRATIYHLGTFRKLKELNLLDKIDVISSNSGGSITAAAYSLNHKDFKNFNSIIKEGVKKEIVLYVLVLLILVVGGVFTARYWLPFELPSIVFSSINTVAIIGLIFFQFKVLPISKFIEYKYDKIFFKKKKLKNLSSSFKTTINSTNVSTGRIFYFSKEAMTDSTYSHPITGNSISFNHEEFPVSRAVMASSCVPGAFSPIRIKKYFFTKKEDSDKINPKLVDGGVYDNQGIHKLTFLKSSSYCKNVIVSDAGNFLPHENWSFNSLFLLTRVGSIFMNRIKNFQMMDNLYSKHTNSIIAYQSLAFDLENSLNEFLQMLKEDYIHKEVINAHEINQELIDNEDWKAIVEHLKIRIEYNSIIAKGCNPSELKIARNVRTGLSKLSNKKINALVKHSEAITELQIKLFLPHIL